jgi:hypothetical protein
MKTQHNLFLLFVGIPALLCSSTGLACPTCNDFPDMLTTLGAASPTKTAVASGNFAATTTWSGGTTPTLGDVVLIPAGVTVTVNNLSAFGKSIIVRGTLKFATGVNTRLRVETLAIDTGGTLNIGTDAAPIAADKTAAIHIIDNATMTVDGGHLARGIIARSGTTIRMVSASQRPPHVTLKNSISSGATTLLTTVAVPASWKESDEVVIPATEFTRRWVASMPGEGTVRLPNEMRVLGPIITGANPGLNITEALNFAHTRADTTDDAVRVHVANLTRNIVLRSENSGTAFDRSGHAMFMTNDVIIKGVRFENFGRTDKFSIASDPRLNTDVYNVPGGNKSSNPRGRYAVHFHKAGPDTATIALVQNSVVVGTPGWGFVNHSSRVNFKDNVAFDFDGAGFAAEDGDEQGSFDGNIAIGGRGNGEFSILRTIFENFPRTDQGDMGFTGEGFWFQGPDVSVTNNIAAGCKGSGFLYWPVGRFDTLNVPGGAGSAERGHFTGRPLTRAFPTTIKPRKWDYDGNGTPDAYVLSDFPLKAFSGNTAYGCLTGLKIRFCNHPSNAAFGNIQATNLETEIIPADGEPAGELVQATRIQFTLSDSLFWNNLNGIHGHYLTNCRLQNIKVIATEARTSNFTAPIQYSAEAGQGAIGLDFHTQVGNGTSISFTNVLVRNYTTGLWRESLPNGTAKPVGTGITYEGCHENVFTEDVSPGAAKGRQWFDQILTTNNIPDNPQ